MGCRGRDHPIFCQVFYFFPFSGTSEYRKSLSFSSAMCPLWRHGFASLYRSLGTNWYFYQVYHTTTIHGTHMNLNNNAPRMHHITPFWDEKFINLLGRGTAPPRTPHLAAYGALILASSALDLRPPNVPVALTPMNTTLVASRQSCCCCARCCCPLVAPATDMDRKGGRYHSSLIMLNSFLTIFHPLPPRSFCLQCFDAVGWAAGRASGL